MKIVSRTMNRPIIYVFDETSDYEKIVLSRTKNRKHAPVALAVNGAMYSGTLIDPEKIIMTDDPIAEFINIVEGDNATGDAYSFKVKELSVGHVLSFKDNQIIFHSPKKLPKFAILTSLYPVGYTQLFEHGVFDSNGIYFVKDTDNEFTSRIYERIKDPEVPDQYIIKLSVSTKHISKGIYIVDTTRHAMWSSEFGRTYNEALNTVSKKLRRKRSVDDFIFASNHGIIYISGDIVDQTVYWTPQVKVSDLQRIKVSLNEGNIYIPLVLLKNELGVM